MSSTLDNRHIIAIGTSSGGVDALRKVVGDLPPDLPASVFVVLHIGENSQLPQILESVGPLPAAHAESREPIENGRIYVAPPDKHLLLHDSHVLLRRGPRENMARPAIDPLFRSAVCSFGAKTIGVVLTGGLSDGTGGLQAIKSGGGMAVVQDPATAVAPNMPQSALRHASVDHCVPLESIGSLLGRLAAEPAGASLPVPVNVQLEAAIAAQEHGAMMDEDKLGNPTGFVCPDCRGPLWEVSEGALPRFRCRVGHAFTGDAILAAQAEEVERSLWSLLNAHQQRAEITRRLAKREAEGSRQPYAQRLHQRARECEEDAEVVRRMLHGREGETAENA